MAYRAGGHPPHRGEGLYLIGVRPPLAITVTTSTPQSIYDYTRGNTPQIGFADASTFNPSRGLAALIAIDATSAVLWAYKVGSADAPGGGDYHYHVYRTPIGVKFDVVADGVSLAALSITATGQVDAAYVFFDGRKALLVVSGGVWIEDTVPATVTESMLNGWTDNADMVRSTSVSVEGDTDIRAIRIYDHTYQSMSVVRNTSSLVNLASSGTTDTLTVTRDDGAYNLTTSVGPDGVAVLQFDQVYPGTTTSGISVIPSAGRAIDEVVVRVSTSSTLLQLDRVAENSEIIAYAAVSIL